MEKNLTAETLQLIAEAQQKPDNDISRSFTQSGTATSGITYYDLEPGAKLLYPVLTPLRNEIPRVSGKGGIQANWRAVTGVNTSNAGIGISEGNRGAIIATTTADYLAAYKSMGLDDYVTFEAENAAAGFDDANALCALGLLRAVMIAEEKTILGGNNSIALGTVGTITKSAVAGGSLADQTWDVSCVALTLSGYLNSSVSGGLPLSATRTLADGTTEAYNQGTSIKASVVTQATSGSNNSIAASVAPIKGAVAYAWFWGASGAATLGAITTINSVLITAAATGTQLLSAGFAADKSCNSLVYDGLFSQINTTASGAYIATLATGTAGTGTVLTSDSYGGITQIETALQSFWDNYRLSPSCIWVSSQEMKNIGAKVFGNSSSGAQKFQFVTEQGAVAGGVMVRSYLNKYSMDGAKEIPVKLHPNMPPGTILFTTNGIPYPLSNVSNLLQVRCRKDYYQISWPLRTRKREIGVYLDSVLQNMFPPAFGMITNIANG